MMESRGCSAEEAGEEGEQLTRKKSRNKKRFSDEQVQYLESIFESDSKLEARKKEELAVELGMQPRQVAIWFQNKRARWKSKQIEHDYKALRASYDALTSRFESLKEEKQSLLTQLQKLGDLVEKPGDGVGSGFGGNSSTDGGSDTGDDAKLSYLEGGLDHRLVKCSDDDKSRSAGYFGHQEGPELLDKCENADISLESTGKWFGFASGGFHDQSCTISQLWDFWSS